MNANVISAIFRRNFFSYFANPTGYVFICVFVALSSFAAFWPNEFFNTNLANLDQLNKYLPYILLVFIPAITMSIWADERRQGTDELLLTIPGTDFDVVLGKYLAAVAIYTVAIVFSLFCNYVVLFWLGNPDPGLFLATYVGYWFVGLAMLAIGMVASFLTGNLTVGFVLGALFNAPLAFADSADVILPQRAAQAVRAWSLESQFRDFGRGVITLSSICFFLLLVVAMLYLSMLLIGRRHWQGSKDSQTRLAHYFLRFVSLLLIVAGVVLIVQRFDYRADASSERISSLSPQTKTLISNLDPKHPVQIDAYISPIVPEAYVQTRLNLLSALREFETLNRSKVIVRIHDTEPLSDNADLAEKQFDISGHRVSTLKRGARTDEEIYLGVAFTSGLNKVVLPFIDRGIPVEYEMARSIATVAQQKRKKLGVLQTDARLMGGFDQQTFRPTQDQPLIVELKKQYDVVQVSADAPITEKYDALLAVQPSTLSPEQMDNFIAAVRAGQPTAIFEDPFPAMAPGVAPTSAEKQPAGGMMGMGQRPQPKGNIQPLWDLLGVDFSATQIVAQKYNPLKKYQEFPDEFVFVDTSLGDGKVFNQEDPISAGLQSMLFVFPGSIRKLNASPLTFEKLITTGPQTLTVAFDQILTPAFFGGGGGLNPNRQQVPSGEALTIAAHIFGTPKADPMAALTQGDKKPDEKPAEVNVVLVTDIDSLTPAFFDLRARGKDPEGGFDLDVDNVTFVLNALDALAKDSDFIDIRTRRPRHRVLTEIENRTKESREESIVERKKIMDDYERTVRVEEEKIKKEFEKLDSSKELTEQARMQQAQIAMQTGMARVEKLKTDKRRELNQKLKEIDVDLNKQVTSVQNWYKFWAVVLPPSLPLMVGLLVYFNRRAKEREGVAPTRLKT
ncbi:MAG TPA: Gldg family protein [Pirellulales bacterium]|jgi:ABC-2 type transport system permease protein